MLGSAASAARRWPLWTFVTAALVVLATLAAVTWYVALPHYRPPLRPGEDYGIDVSRHQGAIEWSEVRSDDISFAYIKATEGGDLVDVRFSQNWRNAREAGLQRGAYHFFTLCRPGAEQARNFLSTAPPEPHALPPAVDLELGGNCSDRPAPRDLLDQLQVFLRAVEQAWGQQVIIYTNDEFDERYPVRALGRKLWEPQHYRRPPGSRWTLWQVTNRAAVDGINGLVDLDIRRP